MIFFPAIDLKDGKCVRLLRGNMELATVFANNPVKQAKTFQEAGCDWLHVVDLNGAFEGRPVNGSAIDGILAETNIKVQLGGGIRDHTTIKFWLDKGVSRVILGTAALKEPAFVKQACKIFPGPNLLYPLLKRILHQGQISEYDDTPCQLPKYSLPNRQPLRWEF